MEGLMCQVLKAQSLCSFYFPLALPTKAASQRVSNPKSQIPRGCIIVSSMLASLDVGPGRYSSPRHRMQCKSSNEGSMTWRATLCLIVRLAIKTTSQPLVPGLLAK